MAGKTAHRRGPTWIDFDRFDVRDNPVSESREPEWCDESGDSAANPYDKIRPVVERILEERFHLKYHTADQPLPGFVATVARDGPKLAAAKDPTAPGNCQPARQGASGQTVLLYSEAIAQFWNCLGAPSVIR